MTQAELMDCISTYIEENHPEKTIRQYDLNQMWLGVDAYIEEDMISNT